MEGRMEEEEVKEEEEEEKVRTYQKSADIPKKCGHTKKVRTYQKSSECPHFLAKCGLTSADSPFFAPPLPPHLLLLLLLLLLCSGDGHLGLQIWPSAMTRCTVLVFVVLLGRVRVRVSGVASARVGCLSVAQARDPTLC